VKTFDVARIARSIIDYSQQAAIAGDAANLSPVKWTTT
jgi:hypothetical protein